MKLHILACCELVLCVSSAFSQMLPAGTTVEARLLTATGSRLSRPGDRVEGTIIAPVSLDGRIVIPQGSTISGTVQSTERLGLALKHVTASIRYRFDHIDFSDGKMMPVETEVLEVETAKERVAADGTVHGIHPLASLSSSLAFYTVPVLFTTPTVGVPVWAVKALVVPPTNPEIYFPVGTELILRLTAPVDASSFESEPSSIASLSPSEVRIVRNILDSLPEERAKTGKRPADLVNIVLIGSRQQIEDAFHAAGWFKAERKSPLSLYRMYYALTRRIGYRRAPMNALTLAGRRSDLMYQKSLDTVERRHHVRLWERPSSKDLWFGTAAQDVAFRFRLAHWTHSISPEIDNERAKVVNDLTYTKCISAVGLVSREINGASREAAFNRPFITDGQAAAVRFNACGAPRMMPQVALSSLPRRKRFSRIFGLFGEDFVRSNILFTTYNTIKLIREHHAFTPREAPNLAAKQPSLGWLESLRRSGAGLAQ